MLEVERASENPMQPNKRFALGFADGNEARGWHLYLSAALGIVEESEGRTFEALCAKEGLAGHAAHKLGAMFSAGLTA